jgi:hypothetical protein
MFTLSFTPRGEYSLLFRRMEGRTENFTPGDNLTPRGQNSSLVDNFAPGGQSLPLGAKLRMGRRIQSYDHTSYNASAVKICAFLKTGIFSTTFFLSSHYICTMYEA